MKNGPYEIIVAPEGYPGKKYRGRYAYEHIVKWWQVHGKVPEKGYEIHHKNMNHRDNRIVNLQLVTSTEHKILHGQAKSKQMTMVFNCGFCNKETKRKGSNFRFHLKVRKFGKLFCSAKCGALHQHSIK